MRTAKVFTLAAVCMFAVTAVFAQAKSSTVKTPKSIPATVIVLPDNPMGGVDEGLNTGLNNYLGAPLDVKTVTRDEALKDPKYSGFNLDYMPLYLIHKTPYVAEKFKDNIEKGYTRATDDFIVLEKDTRYGVHVNRERKPNVLEVFVMSQCPYGAMAEGKIIDARKLGRMPDHIKVDVKYIVSPGRGSEPFSSLHGSPEWEENVRQLIIKDKYPNKFWKYLEIRNKNYNSSLWDQAAEQAGINPNVFKKYWKRGVELLKEDMEYSREMGVGGSPTFLWEGRVTTDMGGLGNIPGLEGLAQTNSSFGGAQGAPSGQC